MDFQNIVKDIKRSGLTQQQIAEFVNCSQKTISAIERGVTEMPTWEVGNALVNMHRVFCRNGESLQIKQILGKYVEHQTTN